MRVSKAVAAAHRAAIVQAAAKLILERGTDAPSVAEITAAAGLTHGGFYGHFASKQALIAEAVGVSLDEAGAAWSTLAGADAADPLGALVTGALDMRADGAASTVGLIAADMSRAAPETRQAFSAGLDRLVEIVADALPAGTEEARREALGTLTAVVGALVLASAVDDDDVRAEILAAGRGLFGL